MESGPPFPQKNGQLSEHESLMAILSEEVKCPICLEFFEDPRIGCPIGHSFCLSCLKVLAKKKGNFIECPLCRSIQKLDKHGVEALPRNIYVANVVDKLKSSQKIPYPYNLYIPPKSNPNPQNPEPPLPPPIQDNPNPILPQPPEPSPGLLSKLSNFFTFNSANNNNQPAQQSPQNPVVSVQLKQTQPIPIQEPSPGPAHPYLAFFASPKQSPSSSPKQISAPIPPPMQKFPVFYSGFDMSEETAKKKFVDWIRTLWFAPSNFVGAVKVHEISAHFIPFWCYDVNSICKYEGRTLFLEKQPTADGSKSQTVEKWVVKHGECERFHKQYLYLNEDQFKNELEPFHSLLVTLAQKKDVDPAKNLQPNAASNNNAKIMKECLENQAWMKVQSKILKDEEDFCENKLKNDEKCVRVEDFRLGVVTFQKQSVTLIFIPFYVGTYDYEGNKFKFVVNAQTGTVESERPYGFGALGSVAQTSVNMLGQFVINSIFGEH